MESKKTYGVECLHCGTPTNHPLTQDQNFFCCQGCAQVYHYLQGHDLLKYYEVEENAPQKVEFSDDQNFELLKETDFCQPYISYQDDSLLNFSWHLPAIHCRACVWLLEKLPEIETGIYDCKVDLMRKNIQFKIDPHAINMFSLANSLQSLGYAPDLKTEKDQLKSESHSKEEWLQIGVSGFCFGNVMLFSFPEYLGGHELGKTFENLFRWLNLILSLPVLFYCAKNILLSGLRATRFSSLGVDTPISLGIITLFLYSSYEVLTQTGSGYFDSLCGLVFFLLLGRSFQRKNFQNLVFEKDEHRFFPLSVSALVKNDYKDIPLKELKANQIYKIKNGGMVPTDSELVQGDAALDYRLVTGESELKIPNYGQTIYAGGLQKKGELTLKALKKVHDSSLSKLWENASDLKAPKFETFLDKTGRVFTVLIVTLAILTFYLWQDHSFGKGIELACAVLIIACPCALALSAPLSLGSSLRQFAKQGCYIRSANIIEIMSQCDSIIFDKTGTLSKIDESRGTFQNKDHKVHKLARALAKHSNHPIACAIYQTGSDPDLNVTNFHSFTNSGIEGVVENHQVKIGKGSWAYPNDVSISQETVIVIDGELADLFQKCVIWRDEILDKIPKSLNHLDLYLLSGDHDQDKDALLPFFKPNCMHFDQSPQDKSDFVKSLQAQGHITAMIGDGVNDALALRAADVGITIPIGSGQFSPSSDIIIPEDKFLHLSNYLTYSRKSLQVIYIGITVSLLYNFVGISAAMSGWVSPLFSAILMPISSLTVVSLSIGLTTYYSRKIFSRQKA